MCNFFQKKIVRMRDESYLKYQWRVRDKIDRRRQWKYGRSKKNNIKITDVFLCQRGEILWWTNIIVVQMNCLHWWFIKDSRVEGFNFDEVARGDMAQKIMKVDLNKMGTRPYKGWELVSDWKDQSGWREDKIQLAARWCWTGSNQWETKVGLTI